jgi:hypothetical protein
VAESGSGESAAAAARAAAAAAASPSNRSLRSAAAADVITAATVAVTAGSEPPDWGRGIEAGSSIGTAFLGWATAEAATARMANMGMAS